VRGNQRLTNGLIKHRIRRLYRKCEFLSSDFSCFFQQFCSLRFRLVLDPRGTLGEKVGSACEEFEDNEGGIMGSMFLRVLV